MGANAITRSGLARRLGLIPAYITKVLRGYVNFTVESMVRLVRAAGDEINFKVAPKPHTKRTNFYKKQGMGKTA